MNTTHEDIVAILLAGGEGRRIGGSKGQKLLAKEPLLGHVRRFAEARCGQVILSVRDIEDAPPGIGLAVVEDRPGLVGPLAGLLAGAEAAKSAGASMILMVACDCPFLPDDLVDRLAAALDKHPDAGMASGFSGGRLHPTVSLIRLDRDRQMEAVAKSGNLRLMALFDTLDGVSVPWSVEETSGGALDPFFNINDWHDLRQAEFLYPHWTKRQKSSV